MQNAHRPAIVVAAILCAPAAHADSDWERTMLLYILGAGLDGTTQVGPVATDIDQSFSDLLDNLRIGGMGAFRASNGTWAHTIDAIYTDLEGDANLPGNVRLDAELGQLIASYDVGYRLAEHFEVLAGVRYNSIDADVEIRTPLGSRRGSDKTDWFDPYVGFGSQFPFAENFVFAVRGDIGGFDVGSKLAWQAILRVDWLFGETFFASAGYRILDMDYEDGSGSDFFKLDVTISGPALGIGWRFR